MIRDVNSKAAGAPAGKALSKKGSARKEERAAPPGDMLSLTGATPASSGQLSAKQLEAAAKVLSRGATDGEKVWEFDTRGRVSGAPAVGPDGTVYAGSASGSLFAIREGKEAWEFKAGAPLDASPCLAPDGTVYAAARDGVLHAVKEGKELWSLDLGGRPLSTPGLGDDGVVYVGSQDGFVHCVKDGETQWKVFVDDWCGTPLQGPKGSVIIETAGGKVSAFRHRNGFFGERIDSLWDFKAGLGVNLTVSSPVPGRNGECYVACADGLLFAVKEGKKLWELDTGSAIKASPCLGPDNTVYIGNAGQALTAVRDGKKIWEFEAGAPLNTTPCIASDGSVCVGADDGKVYAVKEGTLAWSFKTGGPVTGSPVAGEDGLVYAGSMDGKVYALRAPSLERQVRRELEAQEKGKAAISKEEQWVVVDGVKLEVKK